MGEQDTELSEPSCACLGDELFQPHITLCTSDSKWSNADESASESHKEVNASEPEKKSGTDDANVRKRKKDKKQVCVCVRWSLSDTYPPTVYLSYLSRFFHFSNLLPCV